MATKKAPAKKATAAKSPAKNAPAKKAAAAKSPAKKAPLKKAAANKATNPAPAKKATAAKSPAKKATPSKGSTKKIPAKKDAATGLKDFMIECMKDVYWAEKALLKAIPKMAKNATDAKLKAGLNNHLKETEGQVKRLEQAFSMLDEKAQGKKCEAMAGLIKEAQAIMEETEQGVVRDAGIIAAAQKVEHYEIASYGTICAFAKVLGKNEVATLLHDTLEEEKAADASLTDAAYNDINLEAAN